ncbi:hypothetical protein D5086_025817 [Populus alba]|uniref:Uncharacterized protein n=2 Tax=Populus alba TaxID=43335 RepID=A0ACC4B065_POPAL|nr:hypothetical protein D5086_0000046910 [Populus alba]
MSGVQSVRMSVVQFGLGVHIMGGVMNKEELKMSSFGFPVKLERSFKNYSSKKLDKSPIKAARNNQPTSLRNVKQEFKGKVSGGASLNIVASDIDLFKDEKKLKEPLLFANACGAISVYRRAAIPAVPPKDAVLKVLRPGALLE